MRILKIKTKTGIKTVYDVTDWGWSAETGDLYYRTEKGLHGEYKNPVACTSLAKANGNLFFCIPKATNNYIFIDAEWEIK